MRQGRHTPEWPLLVIRAALLCALAVAVGGAVWWVLDPAWNGAGPMGGAGCPPGLGHWGGVVATDAGHRLLFRLFLADGVLLGALAVAHLAYAVVGSARSTSAGA